MYLHAEPECIAQYTKRPLLVLTSSDIGTDTKEIELNLASHFKTATSWGAVLLIDEADVFMERRSTADLERNSLVAGELLKPHKYKTSVFRGFCGELFELISDSTILKAS